MSIYYNNELLPANTLFPSIDDDPYDEPAFWAYPWAIPFDKLCQASLSENMKPLDGHKAVHQLYAQAMVGHFLSAHGTYHLDAVSYAAITGFQEHNGKKLAQIGGAMTLPSERGQGHSTTVVGKVIELASAEDAIAEHGHEGFIANCNPKNVGFFVAKLGFELVETGGPIHIAVRTFNTNE